MTKQELRKIYLQKRLTLSRESYLHANQQLVQRFFQDVDFSHINVIHIFLSITKNNEPETWPIITKIKSDYPAVRVSLPRVNISTNQLENFYFENKDQLKTNAWGIPEPQYGAPTLVADIDLVLVPLLCFDLAGNRVGYGKGFYDKFLRHCKSSCRKVGLSLFEPTEKIDDITDTDIPLDICITPEKTWQF